MIRITALALAVLAASPSYSQTSATGQEIVLASATALQEGNPARAAQLAEVILAVKPNDLDALILRSRAALAMQDYATAQILAKRAFRSTNNPNVKFSTARLVAISHADAGEDTRGQLWLRRARQFAPDEERAEQVAQEFQLLARRNPWSTSLQFGITPSSNVNGGTAEDTYFSSLIDFLTDGQAGNVVVSIDGRDLPGLEFTGGLRSSYLLGAQEKSATFLNFGANFRAIALQQSAVDAENDKERARVEASGLTYTDQVVKGSDFSYYAVSSGLLHRRILNDGWDPTSFQLDLSRAWYAGDPLSWQYTASVSQSVPISDQFSLRFRAAKQQRNVFERDDRDPYEVDSLQGSVGATYQFENQNTLSVSFNFEDSDSSSFNSDYTQRGIYADIAIAEPVAGMQFGFGLGYSERKLGFDPDISENRVNETISLNARTRFTQIEYYGFQPEISVNASRSISENTRYDYDTVRIGFDLRSSF